MANMLEFLGSINSGDKMVLDEADPYKDYVPFQINNGLSQHMDTIMLANEMNKRPWLSKEMQYKFLAGVVTKKKRYGKWAKLEVPTNQADIDTVSEFYSVNKEKAAEYLKLIPETELEYMRKQNDKGGADITKPKTKAKK